jgi:ATP-dependent Clp protease ATP-binding subunit ClpC
MVEDPLSERLLHKEFRAGHVIIVDVEDDPDSKTGDKRLSFRAVEAAPPADAAAEAIEPVVAGGPAPDEAP